MLMEPQERLTGAAEFSHLVEDQADCILHPPVWVLLQPIAGFDEADRRGSINSPLRAFRSARTTTAVAADNRGDGRRAGTMAN